MPPRTPRTPVRKKPARTEPVFRAGPLPAVKPAKRRAIAAPLMRRTEATMEATAMEEAEAAMTVITRSVGTDTLLAFIDVEELGLALHTVGLTSLERIRRIKELADSDDEKVRLGALKELRNIVNDAVKHNSFRQTITQTRRTEAADGSTIEEVRHASRLRHSLLSESPHARSPLGPDNPTARVLLPDTGGPSVRPATTSSRLPPPTPGSSGGNPGAVPPAPAH